MAENRCPGCGAPFNGRKCRICLYTAMETNLSRQVKPISPAPRPGKKRSAAGSMAGFLLILALIAMALPLARNLGWKLEAMDAANRTPEPIPGNAAVLYQQEPITILVPAQEDSGTAIWFCNHSSEQLLVTCREITVNGRRMEDAALSIALPENSAVKSSLPDGDNTDIEELTFLLEVKDRNGVCLFETEAIRWETGKQKGL